jgi:hypothetical protein
MQIIEDITFSSQTCVDMETELAKEMYSYCSTICDKIKRIIHAKQMASSLEGIDVLLLLDA